MKVLLITGSYPPLPCGVGDYSFNLAEALVVHQGIRVSILTSVGGAENPAKTDGINVFPVMKNWEIAEIFKVVKNIRNTSPDIVHIQYPTQGYKDGLLPWLIPLIAFLMRKKVVQTWHEVYTNPNDKWLSLQAVVPGGLIVVRPEYKKQVPPKLQWVFRKKIFRFIRNASAVPKIELSEHEQSEVRRKYINQRKRLIVFFGFIFEHKGTELIFDVADPDLDQIIIAGQWGGDERYYQRIKEQADREPWAGKVTFTGFLPSGEMAALLAVADAVVLPFRTGGGEWNTSIHGAVVQGVFVLTTSATLRGYDKKHNVYYSEIDNISEMKAALANFIGKRREYDPEIDRDEWQKISDEHLALYKEVLAEK